MGNSKGASTLWWVIIAVVVAAAGLAIFFGSSFFNGFFSSPTASPLSAQTISFYLEPADTSYGVGEQFTLDVRLNAQESQIAALSAYLLFDPERLEVVSLDSADSAFSIEAEQEVDEGLIKITRGQPKPGVSGNNVLVARINLKAKAAGRAAVDFSLINPGAGPSRVILADGQGTDILEEVVGASYEIR